jgi:hypothetical protein
MKGIADSVNPTVAELKRKIVVSRGTRMDREELRAVPGGVPGTVCPRSVSVRTSGEGRLG